MKFKCHANIGWAINLQTSKTYASPKPTSRVFK